MLCCVSSCVGHLDPSGFDVLCLGDSELQAVDNLQFFFRGPPTAGTMTLKSVLELGPKCPVSGADIAEINRQIQEFVWGGLPLNNYFFSCVL